VSYLLSFALGAVTHFIQQAFNVAIEKTTSSFANRLFPLPKYRS